MFVGENEIARGVIGTTHLQQVLVQPTISEKNKV